MHIGGAFCWLCSCCAYVSILSIAGCGVHAARMSPSPFNRWLCSFRVCLHSLSIAGCVRAVHELPTPYNHTPLQSTPPLITTPVNHNLCLHGGHTHFPDLGPDGLLRWLHLLMLVPSSLNTVCLQVGHAHFPDHPKMLLAYANFLISILKDYVVSFLSAPSVLGAVCKQLTVTCISNS